MFDIVGREIRGREAGQILEGSFLDALTPNFAIEESLFSIFEICMIDMLMHCSELHCCCFEMFVQ